MDPDTMTPVPADGETMGEIMFRGNVTMKGYLKNPKATAEAFAGGWFHSGDLAVLQPDGYIKIKDRAKDIIISGGENISSIEVEDALIAIRRCSPRRCGASPIRSGARPLRLRELKDPARRSPKQELIAIAANTLAHFKVPRGGGVRRVAQDLHRQDPEIRAAPAGQFSQGDRVTAAVAGRPCRQDAGPGEDAATAFATTAPPGRPPAVRLPSHPS